METTQMRAQLPQIIEKVDDETVRLLYDIAAGNINEDDEAFTDEEIAELEAIANSGEKTYTRKESMAMVRDALKSKSQ